MPNWNYNRITISHADATEVDRAAAALARNALFEEFVPTPPHLLRDEEEPAAMSEECAAQAIINALQCEVDNAYDWRVANWGTKWDIDRSGQDDFTRTGNSIQFSAYSAWSPPIDGYRNLEKQGWTVVAYYYEPGMGFCGRYVSGCDDCYNIEGDVEWIRENIPQDIIDEMCLLDFYTYEEDEELEGSN